MSSPTNAEIVLPLGAAYILGYNQRQMRVLHDEGVIGHLVHRIGCSAYYIRRELLAFKRQVRMDPEYAAWVESLIEDDDDDDN